MIIKPHIHASELAALIGEHPYVKKHEAFEKWWKRTDPASYQTATERNHVVTDADRVRSLASHDPVVKAQLEEASMERQDTSVDVAMSVAHHEAILPDYLDASSKKVLANEMKTMLSTRYGTTHETPVLDIISKEFGYVVAHGDGKYYKMDIGRVIIGGKIDGLTDDGKQLIEIKNRINRLFMKPSSYENVQVQCYLHIVPTAERALLVEALAGTHTTSINIIPIAKDEAAWSSYTENANAISLVLEQMVSSPELQDAYFRSPRRSFYLRKLRDRSSLVSHPLQ